MNNLYEVAKGISSIDLSLSDHDFLEKIIETASSLYEIESLQFNFPQNSINTFNKENCTSETDQARIIKKITDKKYCPIVETAYPNKISRAFIPILEGNEITLISTIDFHIPPDRKTMLSVEYLISTSWYRFKEKAKNKKNIDDSFFLRQVTQKGSIGIFDWDIANGTVMVSDILNNILGYKSHDISGSYLGWVSRLHPIDRKDTLKYVKDCIRKRNKSLILEHRLRHKKGHYVWIQAQATIYYSESGHAYRIFGVNIDINKLKIIQDDLRDLAHYDSLTGLHNRYFFEKTAKELIFENSRKNKKSALLFLDIDRFKNINDSMGHQYGDKLLIECSKRLKTNLREIDMLGRLGGDEFSIFIQDFKNNEEILSLAKRLITEISEPYSIFGCTAYVGLSIGIAFAPTDGKDLIQLKRAADIALYKSKADGRGISSTYSTEIPDFAIDRHEFETSLRAAMTNGQLSLHYQPKISLTTGLLIGFESLARWVHPERGNIRPDVFIALAKDTGLIIELGKWMIINATKQIQKWNKSGVSAGKIAVNVSSMQLLNSDLVSDVIQAISESNIKPQSLELEITESFLLNDPKTASDALRQIKDIGVSISIDNFGKGLSSLGYLKDLPWDAIKIDKSFTRDISGDTKSRALVRAIIAMSHELDLDVIAEGVACKEDVEVLKALGCDVGQGWYFSKELPVPFMNYSV